MTDHLATLDGGVAVITGAGSGIGEGLARYAAELGMKVVLADIDQQRIERIAAEIEVAGGTALAVPTDVSQSEALENLADRAYAAFGDVQLLINNAALEVLGFTWEIPADTWNKTLGINIREARLYCQHGLRRWPGHDAGADFLHHEQACRAGFQ